MAMKTFLTTAAAAVAALTLAPTVHADPDPHIPDPVHGRCTDVSTPPQIYWTNSWYLLGVCDGAPYPDGTYWHVQGFVTAVINVMCAAGTPGQFNPPPAQEGGCEGRPAPVIILQR